MTKQPVCSPGVHGSLLRKNPFMVAVGEARRATFEQRQRTLGAYQCYGDLTGFSARRDGRQ